MFVFTTLPAALQTSLNFGFSMSFKDPAKRKQYAEEYYARKVMRKNGELSLQHIHCRGTKYTVAVFCHVSLHFAS